MKTKQILSCVPFMFVLVTGCTWDTSSPINPISPLWPTTTSMKHGVYGAQANGEIIQEMMTLDKAEIASANVARQRAQNPEVKRYAAMLHTQHSKCLHKLRHLSHRAKITPVISTGSQYLEQHSKQELAQLQSVPSNAFDRTYIEHMIQDHRTALSTIDQGILQSSNAHLTKLLKEARHHVAMHLQKAEAIQKHLMHS
ncbi:MAG: hypothetical protein CK424_05145 [Legionella sp.]|nr:MAG: hypothetical protein CK424_05145 [Legionella sp.]